MARSDWRRPEVAPLPEGVRRVRLTLAYDGSAFNGWQAQENGWGVQDEVEKALEEVIGSKTRVQGSGRTDRGVHAIGQVAHFDIPVTVRVPGAKFAAALNTKLPGSVRILDSSDAPEGFHARFTAMTREYVYFVKATSDALPCDKGRITLLKKLPDLERLQSYASVFAGTHDFTTFCSAKDPCPSKFRDIYESEWSLVSDVFGRPVLRYRVAGNAFLYHQVRSMVGAMVHHAREGADASVLRSMLEARDRSLAPRTAPSDGLYLSRVTYDPAEYQWFEDLMEEET